MSLRRVVLLRHGQTAWNAEWRMQGQLDPELDEIGLKQAAEAAPRVAVHAPSVLISSDLQRAWATAEAAATATGLEAHPDPRLRETAMGEWEGLTGPEVEARWPGGIEAWRRDPTLAPPGGESRLDVAARGVPVLHELIERTAHGDSSDAGSWAVDPDGSTALLVAHGGTIIALTAGFLGWPVPVWPSLAPLHNCRWALLDERRGSWRLAGWGLGAA